MKSHDEQFMRMAIAKARQGVLKGQTPFGACIVKNGKVVSCEHNTVWKDTDITSHAEVHAIRKACKKLGVVDLKGCVLYSTCEPCPMCFSACHWANISHVIFGAKIADAQKAGFRELTISNQRMKSLGKSPLKVTGGFLREECAELFRFWGERRDKRIY